MNLTHVRGNQLHISLHRALGISCWQLSFFVRFSSAGILCGPPALLEPEFNGGRLLDVQ